MVGRTNLDDAALVDAAEGGWNFLTNHALVLVCLAEDPITRLRDVARAVGITERAVQRIVGDLERLGAIQKIRDGRRNRYTIDFALPLSHPLESHRTLGEFLHSVMRSHEHYPGGKATRRTRV